MASTGLAYTLTACALGRIVVRISWIVSIMTFGPCKQLGWLMLLFMALPAWADEAAAGPQQEPAEAAAESPAKTRPPVPSWPVTSDLVGHLSYMTAHYEDTFAQIGTVQSLGYLELVKANPGVDPWLPGEGTQITLPRLHILPDAKRQGIVINLAEYRLYYFNDGKVKVYPVGVGTDDNPSPLTDATVTMRLESPAWYPPDSVRAQYAATGDHLPRMIPPGPANPLGSHALLLSAKGYLIHGTNKDFGVGTQVSHGCFRMYNDDIERFVYMVDKGTHVQIVNQPVKIGMNGREVWLEVHRPHEKYAEATRNELWTRTMDMIADFKKGRPNLELKRRAIELAVDQADGIPRMIGEQVARVAQDTSNQVQGDPARADVRDSRDPEPDKQAVELLF